MTHTTDSIERISCLGFWVAGITRGRTKAVAVGTALVSVGASIVLAGAALVTGPQFGRVPLDGADTALQTRMAGSPNYSGAAFKNMVTLDKPAQGGSLWRALYEWFAGRSGRAPKGEMPVERLSDVRVGDGRSHVTWMGHSTLLIEIDGKLVMTDPVFSDHASPYGWLPPKSFYKALPVSLSDIDFIDVVLISHDHYDHLDHKTMTALSGKVGTFVVPLGVGAHLTYWGIDKSRIVELDWWQDTTVGPLTLTATPAQHFSGRTLTGGNESLWAGWAIKGSNENLFFSGDSAYFPGFKEIGNRLGPFDLTMVECGAYNEAWSTVHMFPEQTALAHRDLNGRVLMPVHWGRFDLALHPWTEPVERLSLAALKQGIELTQPRIGERFALGGKLPKTKWWRTMQSASAESADDARTVSLPSPQ